MLMNMFKRSWGLMISTSASWNQIESEDISSKQMLRNYFYPWLFVCTAFVMIFSMIYHPTSFIKAGIISGLTTVISYGGTYFITRYFAFGFLNNKFPEKFRKTQVDKIVCYSFAILFIIKIVVSAIPSLFFLKILNIYTIYLVWDACRAILKLDEEERGNFVLICTALILFCPFVISKAIDIMLP